MVDALNLQARINADVVANTPPSLAAMVDRMVADLRERGVTPGIAVGELAPDFEAPDPHGAVVRLADRLARGPVVLSFYRGAWCPICSIELRALRETLPALRARGASLVAVSPQSPDDTLPFVESLDLGFEVLSDLDQSIGTAYRLCFELSEELQEFYERAGLVLPEINANGSWNLPVPATFVIDRDRVVRARHVDPDYRTRMDPSDILAAVVEVTS